MYLGDISRHCEIAEICRGLAVFWERKTKGLCRNLVEKFSKSRRAICRQVRSTTRLHSEKGALTPIRRPRTPQTLPHMLPSGTEFRTGHAVRMPPRTSAAAAVGRHRGPPRIGSENSPRGDADGRPRNSGAPWRRATPPTATPARLTFAGVSEPRLPPPAARAEATGALHATVPGEHRGSHEVSGEQRGRWSGAGVTAGRFGSRLPVRALTPRAPSVCVLADL